MKRPALFRPRNAVLTVLGLVLIAGTTTVVAQTAPLPAVQWDNRRLEQLDRNVRRLERAVTQRNAAGQPVLVEPDPEVIALQGQVGIMDRRLRDLEATVQRVNGDLERLSFQLDESQRDNAAIGTRLRDAETRLRTMETAAQAAAAQREAEAEQAAASPTGDAASDLAAARTLVTVNRQGGLEALERVITNWPNTSESREAEWRIGDAVRAAGDQGAAVSAYARGPARLAHRRLGRGSDPEAGAWPGRHPAPGRSLCSPGRVHPPLRRPRLGGPAQRRRPRALRRGLRLTSSDDADRRLCRCPRSPERQARTLMSMRLSPWAFPAAVTPWPCWNWPTDWAPSERSPHPGPDHRPRSEPRQPSLDDLRPRRRPRRGCRLAGTELGSAPSRAPACPPPPAARATPCWPRPPARPEPASSCWATPPTMWPRATGCGPRGSTLGRVREWSPSPVWPEGRGLMLLRPMLEVRRAGPAGLAGGAGRGLDR